MSDKTRKIAATVVVVLIIAVTCFFSLELPVSQEYAIATATEFFDAINRGDIEKAESLFHPQYESDKIPELKKTDSYTFLTYDKASLLRNNSGLGPQFKNGLWVRYTSEGNVYVAFLKFKRNYRGYGIDLFVCFEDDSTIPPGTEITP